MCPGFLVRSISLSVPANRFAVKREAGMATRPQAREVAPRLVWEGERISSASTVDFNVSLGRRDTLKSTVEADEMRSPSQTKRGATSRACGLVAIPASRFTANRFAGTLSEILRTKNPGHIQGA